MSVQDERKGLRRSGRTGVSRGEQQSLSAGLQRSNNGGRILRGPRKKTSNSASNNPEYRNPVQQAQRRLRLEKTRRDSDDPLKTSLGKASPPRFITRSQQPLDFSPLRARQRSPGKAGTSGFEASRKMQQKATRSEGSSPRQALKGKDAVLHDHVERRGESDQLDDRTLFKDHFPDTITHKRTTRNPNTEAESRRNPMRARPQSLPDIPIGTNNPPSVSEGQYQGLSGAGASTRHRPVRSRRSEPVQASAAMDDLDEEVRPVLNSSGSQPSNQPADENDVTSKAADTAGDQQHDSPEHEALQDTTTGDLEHRDLTDIRSRRRLSKKRSKRKSIIDDDTSPSKRRKRDSVLSSDEREYLIEDLSETQDDSAIYNLQSELHEIYRAVSGVGCRVKEGVTLPRSLPKLRDKGVAALLKICKQTKTYFDKLKGGNPDQDPACLLNELSERVEGLRGRNKEFPTDFENKDTSTAIYSHLIPNLVLLLRSAISCYEVLDRDHTHPGELTLGRLTNTLELISLICDLGETARTAYARPNSEQPVISSVHNKLIVPLRKVRAVLSTHKNNEDLHIYKTQRQQHAAETRALQHQREERDDRLETRIETLRKKWRQLHEERRHVDGGLPSRQKVMHLQIPDARLDTDYNGEPFYRMEVFHARIGPPPSLVDQARLLTWEQDELAALADGLHQYAGPMVYEKIIRRYCGHDGPLNRFNVTELVTCAADFKEYVEREVGIDGLGGWLKGLFVWTKLQIGEGQENE